MDRYVNFVVLFRFVWRRDRIVADCFGIGIYGIVH